MTKRSTKSRLLLSALSLLVCISMFVGSTFAWFTDSVSSVNNIIKSGNLDLKVSYKPVGSSDEWKEVGSDTVLFGEKALYEPGYTEAVWFKVENIGSLAFRYNMAVDVYEEIPGTNVFGTTFNLSEYLDVKSMTTIDSGAVDYYSTRASLDNFAFNPVSLKNKNVEVAKNMVALPGDVLYALVILEMPTTVGNEANHNGKNIPEIRFAVNAFATQVPNEEDSFGPDYDAGSKFDEHKTVSEPQTEGDLTLTEDVVSVDAPLYRNYEATTGYTVNGNGNTVTMVASEEQTFDWIGGTIPLMAMVFSSEDGALVTVNDLTIAGTMQSVMAGNYENSNQGRHNTEFNNVNIVNPQVVSLSAGISPALSVYGRLTMNNCNVYGATLSPLDTDPMWPVYDVALTNYSDTTVNGGKLGSIITWAKMKLTLVGAEVESIRPNGDMNTNAAYGITVDADSTVGTIDLSNIANKSKINITIEDGATVGKIIANGVEYDSIADWQNA